MSACGRHDSQAQALPPHVLELCAQQRWMEAIPLLKQRLLEEPGDAVAHFLYGSACAHAGDFYPALIEGELRMALALVEAGADTGEQSPAQFKLACYLELGDLHLGLMRLIVTVRANADVQRAAYQRFAAIVDQARAIEPDNPRVMALQEARIQLAPR